MNSAHIHLILNHIPVIGLGFAALLLLYGLVKKSTDVVRASFLMYVLVALGTIAVFLSGLGAEDVVEGMPQIYKPMIEVHEEAAIVSLIGVLLIGIVVLVTLISARSRPISRKIAVFVLALSVLVGLFVGYTSNLGAKIHHPEVRANFVPPPEHVNWD
ncbi:hypothetical protein KKG05_10345 [bacterium]|nr:hypothetical protein [bacterium]MBU1937786.1 hypothetical protein [bacterium]